MNHPALSPANAPKGKRTIVKALQNGGIVLVSLFVCLAVLEIALRFLAPQYKYAAMARHVPSKTRIFSNQPNASKYYKAPDSDRYHVVRFNSLGMRQNREFSATKPEGVLRFCFLGDSYTANVRMPVGYSFSEPLDYLLNSGAIPAEVLNFGVDGYGPDQEYLQLVDDVLPLKPDIVFYMYCSNDIRNVLENELFDINASGELVYRSYKNSVFNDLIKNFYLTYLFLDAAAKAGMQNFDAILGVNNEILHGMQKKLLENLNTNRFNNIETDYISGKYTQDVKKSESIFSLLLHKMQDACAASGAKFVVVLLPGDNRTVKAMLDAKGFDSLDLTVTFDAFTAQTHRAVRFASDGHWNEEGNKVAALALYRCIAQRLGRPEGEADRRLGDYYRAFNDGRVSGDGLRDGEDSPERREAIRQKYGLEPPGTANPDK